LKPESPLTTTFIFQLHSKKFLSVVLQGVMTQTRTNPRLAPRMAIEAAKTDDPSLMAEALAAASDSESKRQDLIAQSLRRSAKRKAIRAFTYLLDEVGANVNTLHGGDVIGDEDPAEPSLEILNIMIRHGWNIDNHGPSRTDWPLLWYAVRWPDLVAWCLEHGASVYIPSDTPPRDANGVGQVPRMTILERATVDGTVATFELLRAQNPPFSPKLLHRATEKAGMCAPKDGEAKSELFEQRMAMVRHLVDVVGCDVNVVATWAGKWCSTPLCHFANRDDGRDKRELISFLLERGADPDLAGTIVDENTNLKLPSAIECAQSGSNTRFVEAVRELQAEKRGGAVGAT
jgi:hypothetical protein